MLYAENFSERPTELTQSIQSVNEEHQAKKSDICVNTDAGLILAGSLSRPITRLLSVWGAQCPRGHKRLATAPHCEPKSDVQAQADKPGRPTPN